MARGEGVKPSAQPAPYRAARGTARKGRASISHAAKTVTVRHSGMSLLMAEYLFYLFIVLIRTVVHYTPGSSSSSSSSGSGSGTGSGGEQID